MAHYIPVHSSSRKDCEALHKVYKKESRVGGGSFGEVYQSCIRATDDCGYVLKVITCKEKTSKSDDEKKEYLLSLRQKALELASQKQ